MSRRPQGSALVPSDVAGAAIMVNINEGGMAMKSKVEGADALVASTPGVNEVIICGRLSGSADERELPSGDTVVQLRIVVPRPRARVPGAQGATVDTIDVACWTKALQRRAIRLSPGDLVTVRGALRRRFWRSPGGAASRYEVEATRLDRGVVPPVAV